MEPSSVFKQHCLDLLSSNTVAVIPQPKQLIQIDSTTGLFEAFEILLTNDILSAPVYDSVEKVYTGFLDIRDLVSYVVFVHDNQKISNNSQLADVIKHGTRQTATTEGANVKYLSRRNKFTPVSKTDSLLKVCQLMASPYVHRVPILEDGKLVGLITQTMLISFFARNLTETTFDHSHDPVLANLKVGTAPVLTISNTESVINTFRLMDNKKRSGIALVDSENRLVGTTTGKDLGLFIKNPTLASLNQEIFEYLKQVRQSSIEIKAPLIAVKDTEKLSKVVGLLAATKVHRVYVVDHDDCFCPVSVVSITDILAYIVH